MVVAPKGNLIANGDFELGKVGEAPECWESTNVLLVGSSQAFTGLQAAAMGAEVPLCPAVMYQDIPVFPGRRFLLSFQMASLACTAGDLLVQVRWQNNSGCDLGPGLYVFISGLSSGKPADGLWQAQSHLTDFSPIDVCRARVVFTRSPGKSRSSPTVIDAVTFADMN
ncbi:MAG TPA: hypothetical protein GX529_03770 [Firmicutes bacterium]|nr:hypothetical protein [Candidatus Fermentithermobacillaceae bacterium]